MKCTRFAGGFICGRGSRKQCKTPGCRKRATAECDWKLHRVVDGKKEWTGKTCDRAMCDECRTSVGVHVDGPNKGEPKDLCPPHHAEAVRCGYLRPGASSRAEADARYQRTKTFPGVGGDELVKHGCGCREVYSGATVRTEPCGQHAQPDLPLAPTVH